MRRACVLACALALVVAAPASAHRHHRHHRGHVAQRIEPARWAHDPLNRALELAHDLWGERPCNGYLAVTLDLTDPYEGGRASFDTPSGPGYYFDPVSTRTDCVLHLNRAMWADADEVGFDWPQLCTIVLHEYGHLTGHVHTDETQFANAPGTVPETPEQAAIMRSGAGSYESDVARCGDAP